MKNYKITKLFFTLCFLLAFADCETSHESLGIRVTDFTKDEWIKIHGESYKSWKLTEIIIPEKFRDDPGLINQTCIADDIYIFSIPTLPGYKGVEEVKIELGDTRCFETFSEAERFEAKLFYYPYTLNGVDVFKINFFLDNDVKVNIMKPFESFNDLDDSFDNTDSVLFWNNALQSSSDKELKIFNTIDLKVLKESFKEYQERIFKNNSKIFMRFVRTFSPVSAFKPVIIKINDLDVIIKLDLFWKS